MAQVLNWLRGPGRTWVISAALGAAAGAYLVRAGSGGQALSFADVLARLEHRGVPPVMLVAVALWMPVSVYWEISARRASARAESEGHASRFVHVSLAAAAQLLLVVPVPGLRGRFVPSSETLVALGLAVECGGAGMAIWARRRLGRHWSGAIATNVGHELIRSGPYRVVRHPIYTGLLGLYLGTALVSGELHALLGLGLAALAYWRKIRLEEAHLRGVFGEKYAEYQRGTWALVPGVV